MIRKDKYKVGDLVEFDPTFDDWRGCLAINVHHQKLYGPGPYRVQKVTPVKFEFRGVGHVQWVNINGVQISGAYFKPLRSEE